MMKAILLIALLTLSTYSYAATLSSPERGHPPSVTNVGKTDLMKKAGETVVSVGKILKNDPSITAEDRENALRALKALTSFQAERDQDSGEYFWINLIKDLIVGSVQAGVSAGVGTGVSAALNRG